METSRRSFLAGTLAGAALASTRASAEEKASPEFPVGAADALASRKPRDLDVLDLTVEGDPKLANRFTLFVPNHLAKGERVPLLVLLHGLGETWSPNVGVFAWVERYGLGDAYARLRRPPVTRTSRSRNIFTDRELGGVNAALSAQPFRGMALACPFTPNIPKMAAPERQLDAYAAWIADVVVPRARKEAPVFADRAHTALDGVSLGGLVGIEVLVRRPEVFGRWGSVQGAFNTFRFPAYADRLTAAPWARPTPPGAAASPATIRLATTGSDPFRAVNEGLSQVFTSRGVAHELVVGTGLHDQVYLREAGSLEMLLWHEQRAR